MNRSQSLPWISLCFVWGLSLPLAACINDYVPNKKAISAARSLAEELTKVELLESWESRRDRLREKVNAGGDYKVQNDLASALMRTGDPKAAIQILAGIEKVKPGMYQTASNLGTAFEVAGDNENAIKWIRKGINLNPKSHDSSEWIHVKILETKIAMARDEDWPETSSILGLDFGYAREPQQPRMLPTGNSGEPLSLDQIETGLRYQLHERLQFVKAPDVVAASLLLDLGNIVALKAHELGSAQGIYELAERYAQSDEGSSMIKPQIELRLRGAKFANQKHSFFASHEFPYLLAIVGSIVLYIALKLRALWQSPTGSV